MVALASCPSCQWGDHEGHVASWNPAPPGVMGGMYCDCPGGCEDLMGPMIEALFAEDISSIEPTDLGDKWQMGCFIWDKEKNDE